MTRWLLVFVPLFLSQGFAFGHGLGVEAKLVGTTVHIEAFFDDDTPADRATIGVTDAAGAVVASGTTDARGVWEFPAPPAGKYAVRIDAGDGHATTTTVTVPEIPAAGPISDGPTRDEFTGWQRVVAAIVGVAAIAAGTWAVRRVRRPAGGAA